MVNRKQIWLFLLMVGLIVNSSFAQTDVALDPEFGARVSAGIDKRITKGFHISLNEEVRFDNNFRSFDRLQTELGLSYKVNPYLKFGLGYLFIAPYSSSKSAFKNLRHRLYADVRGTVHAGRWAFSLRERIQWTYRQGDFNEFQYPRNAFTLKSRLKVKYNARIASPYLYFEQRNFLNAPTIHANFDGTNYLTDEGAVSDEPGWFLGGFKDGYVNRYRSCLGVDLRLSQHNKLNVYFLGDWVVDKVVDANSAGTKLKSYTKQQGFVGSLCAEYIYAF